MIRKVFSDESVLSKNQKKILENAAYLKLLRTANIFNNQAIDLLSEDVMGNPVEVDQILINAGLDRVDLKTLLYNPLILNPVEVRFNAVKAYLLKISNASGRLDNQRDMRLLKLSGKGVVTDFIYEQTRPYLEMLIEGFLRAKLYGYTVFEIQYNKPANRRAPITIKNIWEKPFEWFIPQREDCDLYVRTRKGYHVHVGTSNLKWKGTTGNQEIYVDTSHKYLLVRNKPTFENPYGEAMLSVMYWSYFYDKQNFMFWLKFLESTANQRLVGKSNSDDLANMAEQLSTLIQHGVAAVSAGDTIDAIQPAGNGESYEKFRNLIEKVVWQYFTGRAPLANLTSGSRAGQESENELLTDIKLSDANFCIENLNRFNEMLWRVNKGRLIGNPNEWYYDNEIGLMESRAARDKTLLDSNPEFKFTKEYYLRKYDFMEGDFDIAKVETPDEIPMGNQIATQSNPQIIPIHSFANTVDTQGLTLKKNRNIDAENAEFDADVDAIENQIADLFETQKNAVIDSIDTPENLPLVLDKTQQDLSKFFENIYEKQASKYAESVVQAQTKGMIDELKQSIKTEIKAEGAASFDNEMVAETTQKSVAEIAQDAQKEKEKIERSRKFKAMLDKHLVFSRARARLIALTINGTARNLWQINAAMKVGAKMKKWVCKKDDAVRELHFLRDGKAPIRIDASWLDGPLPIRCPCDHKAHIEDRANCRCHMEFF